MAQHGGEQYRNEEGHHHSDEHAHNPLYSGTDGQNIGGGTGTNIHSTTGGYTGKGGGQGYEEGKHGGGGGFLHRTGSGSSSSSEDDGEGGRRKKKGVIGKIKEKLPGGDHVGEEHNTSATVGGGGGYGYEGDEGHEKKGFMDKIKEKLPGGHQ